MASAARGDRPTLLIVGGPNGSGKSSAYEAANSQFDGRTFWIVNPDRLTARIRTVEGLGLLDANIAAVTRVEAWLHASIEVHRPIGVETVLSTGKYRRLVAAAKQRAFEVWLIYVVLDNVERNIARVASRVAKGGHAVAEADIRKRYHRSLEQLPWFLEQADRAWLYDNSGATLRLAAAKRAGILTVDPSAPRILIDHITHRADE